MENKGGSMYSEKDLIEMERRTDYFLKKKGIYHVKEDMINKLAELEDVMEKEGVTIDALRQGIAPENVLKKAGELEVARIRARGVYGHAHKKALQRGELQNFEQEFKDYNDGIVRKEVSDKAKKEAFDKFLENPDDLNAVSEYMRQTTMPEANYEEHIAALRVRRAEESKLADKRMREEQFKKAVEEEKHRLKTIQDAKAMRSNDMEEALSDKRFGKVKSTAPNTEFQEYSNKVTEQAQKELNAE